MNQKEFTELLNQMPFNMGLIHNQMGIWNWRNKKELGADLVIIEEIIEDYLKEYPDLFFHPITGCFVFITDYDKHMESQYVESGITELYYLEQGFLNIKNLDVW